LAVDDVRTLSAEITRPCSQELIETLQADETAPAR
jgi:hypothetical protein